MNKFCYFPCYISDELSVIIGSSLLFARTCVKWYQSVYINVFSTTTTLGLVDWLSPHIYSLCAGLTILAESPALDGAGSGKDIIVTENF